MPGGERMACPEESEWRVFRGEHEGDDHPHKEITQAIIGAAIRIQSALGPGLLEDGYKLCLAHSLRMDGHKVSREVYVDIEWEGLFVERAYRMDLVVDDRVVVEVKTVEKRVDAQRVTPLMLPFRLPKTVFTQRKAGTLALFQPPGDFWASCSKS